MKDVYRNYLEVMFEDNIEEIYYNYKIMGRIEVFLENDKNDHSYFFETASILASFIFNDLDNGLSRDRIKFYFETMYHKDFLELLEWGVVSSDNKVDIKLLTYLKNQESSKYLKLDKEKLDTNTKSIKELTERILNKDYSNVDEQIILIKEIVTLSNETNKICDQFTENFNQWVDEK